MPVVSIVHVLHHGLPLCGFSRELPTSWPLGHVWLRAEDERHRISCGRCRARADDLFPPVTEPAPTQRSVDLAEAQATPEEDDEEPSFYDNDDWWIGAY